MNVKNKNFLKISIVLFILFIIDRLSKFWAVWSLETHGPFLFKQEIGFEFFCNKGIAFSMAIPEIFIYVFVFGLMMILFFLMTVNRKSFRLNLCLGIILIGAFSNFLDRIKYSCVVDFISLPIFPVFNLADLMIVAGCLLLLFTKK